MLCIVEAKAPELIIVWRKQMGPTIWNCQSTPSHLLNNFGLFHNSWVEIYCLVSARRVRYVISESNHVGWRNSESYLSRNDERKEQIKLLEWRRAVLSSFPRGGRRVAIRHVRNFEEASGYHSISSPKSLPIWCNLESLSTGTVYIWGSTV